MSMSRRELLKLGLGAAQLGLLGRYGLLGSARAQTVSHGPTKLLTIFLDGGLHWETFFTPLTRAGITKFMPAPAGGNVPWGYLPEQVENFDRTPADLDSPNPVRKLRGPIYWNWDNPADKTGVIPASQGSQVHRPYGYAW